MKDHFPTIRFLSPVNLLVMTATVALVVGWWLRHPTLLFVGLTCVFALGRSLWQSMALLSGVSARRTHTPRAFEGQFVPVEVSIRSDVRARHSLVLVQDSFPPGGASRVRHLVREPLERDEIVIMHYTGECVHRRGLYTLGPLRFDALDDLGLIRRVLYIEEFTDLLVYPAAVDLRLTRVLGEGTLAHVGMETKSRPGASEEFIGVRDHRVGDSPNTIHWRSTARTGRLMVKEFHEELTTEVSFFLDLGRMGLTGLGDQTSVEYGIKAVASLAKRAVEKAHAVQLFGIGHHTEHIPPGSGTGHLLLLLDRLAFMKAEGDADFHGAVNRYLPMLRAGGTAVLVLGATSVKIDQVSMMVGAMMARRILPIIVLIDDRAFVKLWREQESRHIEAQGMDEIVRMLMVQGAMVHVVTKAKSPQQALVQGLDRSWLSFD